MPWSGTFHPKNPEKYVDPKNRPVYYRSKIEYHFMKWFDTHPDVVAWNSECCIVNYYDSTKEKIRRYFPDFLVRFKDGRTIMVEIKHSSDLKEPLPNKRKTPKYIAECKTWINNQEKWKAAEQYCRERKWEFRVMSEKNLPKGMY